MDEPLDPSDPRWTEPTTGSHAVDDSSGGGNTDPGSGRSTAGDHHTDETPDGDGTGPGHSEGEPPRHD